MNFLPGIFFIVSAISKLFAMKGFELYIFSFGLADFDLCSYAARLIVAAELILGFGFLTSLYKKGTKYLSLLFVGLFSLFLLWRIAAGDRDSCHCMGDIVEMNPVQSLIKNLLLVLCILLTYRKSTAASRKFRFSAWLRTHRLPVAVSGAAAVTVAVFCILPPDSFFRRGRTSHDLVYEEFRPVADSLQLSEGRKVICFYSATCDFCKRCASKMSGIISRHDLAQEDIHILFMQSSSAQDSVVNDFFERHAGGQRLPYSSLHPFRFIPLTNGSMPLVVLTENGNIVKEYDYISLNEREIRDFLQDSVHKKTVTLP